MKTVSYLLTLLIVVSLTSCATTAKFPVSNVAPAADIKAVKKTDSNKNITLEITAKNLASPDRMSPPGNVYSVWIVTNDYGIKNVGQLMNNNAKKSSFKTVTPFDFSEVFITVENDGNLKFPTGTEISRTRI
ncbi:MAG: hypothetical protein GW772_04375 [Flavobacteriia bacterium]|nr:hypothetical protein [Flavobacteriia bacterium]OIP45228.1 MAG: hypothetical protein AUK46_13000 [Flavobacteriaceae bacterium CG2_30_31_66]PIV97524.1 MAG: hypothetical protein COW43_02580 [Flavobacteriaceae bacterium CG17_big_fil_post_rev_8_21_14_2_50_31_13]PIX15353.1 MAG: hypothetical protein COZ74_00435 [Flavobacteriaceae bacterium CG_4_8_14_3_um_filter_31_8]PIY14274.1 MAG: hypothetical protein COZ16_09755 [Flavobacteriaceae bacterium CG_4_10_14_3_um_filter_31_253]PIZ10126.1 MAG: hypotheti